MYKVFNMGHRLEVYTDDVTAQEIIKVSKSFGIDAQIIGRVEPKEGAPAVTVDGLHGTFTYT
jgi:phosphoribosylformylglycinamidine cyclo-ligase